VTRTERPTSRRAYRSSFREWDSQAWVRSKPHPAPGFRPGLHYFSPALCPVLAHPAVAAAPRRIREDLLVHALYLHLEFTVRLETGPVNEVCLLLRQPALLPGLLPGLPAEMRDDALRIYTDEAGHSEMSQTLMTAVRRATRVSPVIHQPRFLTELADICAGAADVPTQLIKLLFVIVSETLITSTLSDLPDDESVQPPVRDHALDHATDERRHHAYFRQLFDFVWPQLPAATRHRIGPLLPRMIMSFLGTDTDAWTAVFASLPESFPDPARLAAEAATDPLARWVSEGARPTLRMLQAAGVLADPAVRAAFAASPLDLEPDSPCES
jgi:hypothetical protein